jgi:proteasome lid subunit RPN8/RPN11
MLTKKLRKQIVDHAREEYPKECCGILTTNNEYFQCRNIHEDPEKHFKMHPDDYNEFRGSIKAVVHSHPDGTSKMSPADRAYMEYSNIPYVICALPSEEFGVYVPTGYQPPLVGRSFIHGIVDCYGLIRDFYSRELSIDLPNFERADKWWENPENSSLYTENFEKAGFFRVTDNSLAYGDVIICSVGDVNYFPNHALIYLAENGNLKSEDNPCIGTGLVLHHMYGRKSQREIYGEYWQSKTALVVRHKDLSK